MLNLNNKVAIITGAGSGLGKAISMSFAKSGASVFDNNIGKRAKDNNIDININKSTFAGSLTLSNSCPSPTNEKVTIIYIESNLPLVVFVDLSLSQLSIMI